MQISFLIGAVLLTGVSCVSPHEALSADLTDVIQPPILLDWTEYPYFCFRQCFQPALEAISANWTMTDLANTTENICKTHREAISCIRSKDNCFYKPTFFEKAEAYLEQRCGRQNQLYSQVEKCFKPNIGKAMHKCETKCENDVQTFNTMNVRNCFNNDYKHIQANKTTEYLKNICGPHQCLLPCLTKEMNAVCPESGTYTIIALMERLNSMTFMLDVAEFSDVYFQLKNLDPRCHFLINRKLQEKVRKGDFAVFENSKKPESFEDWFKNAYLYI